MMSEYHFGNEGDDYIVGGLRKNTSKIFGGDGDDTIRRGYFVYGESLVRGGKGDDTIGQVAYDEDTDAFYRLDEYNNNGDNFDGTINR